jgi:hypothetical protein
MKKKILGLVLGLSAFVLILFVNPQKAEVQAAVCVTCLGSGAECARVILPNGPHIFYGQSISCEEGSQSTEAQAAVYVTCSGSGPECARIITPNGVQIFYGEAADTRGGSQ